MLLDERERLMERQNGTKTRRGERRRQGIKELRREDQMRKNKEVFPETTATKFKSLWWNNYPSGGYNVSKTAWRQRRRWRQAVLCCAHLNTESNESHRLLKERLRGLSSSWVKLISVFSQTHQLSSQITDITSSSFDGGYGVLDNLYQVTIYEMFDFLTKNKKPSKHWTLYFIQPLCTHELSRVGFQSWKP